MLLGQLVLLSVYNGDNNMFFLIIKKNKLIEKCGDKIPKKREKYFMCRTCETNISLICVSSKTSISYVWHWRYFL